MRGWNQAELARQAGVSEFAVSRFLRGGPVGIAQVAKIARALNRPVEYYATPIVPETDEAPQLT